MLWPLFWAPRRSTPTSSTSPSTPARTRSRSSPARQGRVRRSAGPALARLRAWAAGPRGLFVVMTKPLTKISPPQTPCGSWRSAAPARQARRIGQERQWVLASSRSAGCSENHSWAFSRRHGSGSSSALARVVSKIRELLMTRYRAWIGAVGPRRTRPVPGRLLRRLIWCARTMSASRGSAGDGSCCPPADSRWRLAFFWTCLMSGLPGVRPACGADVSDIGQVRSRR